MMSKYPEVLGSNHKVAMEHWIFGLEPIEKELMNWTE